jgi:hypothetical protein
MEVNATAVANPGTNLSSSQVREEQAVEDEREAGEARREDAQANPGPGVGKIVDISV